MPRTQHLAAELHPTHSASWVWILVPFPPLGSMLPTQLSAARPSLQRFISSGLKLRMVANTGSSFSASPVRNILITVFFRYSASMMLAPAGRWHGGRGEGVL